MPVECEDLNALRSEGLRLVVEDETQSKPVHARYIGLDRLGTVAFNQ